jgi:hypothetical protein
LKPGYQCWGPLSLPNSTSCKAAHIQLSQAILHHGADNAYDDEGLEIMGWPIATMSRGRFIVREGKQAKRYSGAGATTITGAVEKTRNHIPSE